MHLHGDHNLIIRLLQLPDRLVKHLPKKFLLKLWRYAGKTYLVSHGNQNTKIGLALNMLRMRADHELAIFELGISKRGEMSELGKLIASNISSNYQYWSSTYGWSWIIE